MKTKTKVKAGVDENFNMDANNPCCFITYCGPSPFM